MAAAAPIITVLTSSTVTGMIARFALSVAVSFIANKLFLLPLYDFLFLFLTFYSFYKK